MSTALNQTHKGDARQYGSITKGALNRIFSSKYEGLSYFAAIEHKNGIAAFFYNLLKIIFGETNRSDIRASQAKELAQLIKEKIIDIDFTESQFPQEIIRINKNISLNFEKLENQQHTGKYRIVLRTTVLTGNKAQILYSFDDKNDERYTKLETETKLFIEDNLNLFGARVSNDDNQSVSLSGEDESPLSNKTELPPSDLICFIGGTKMLKEDIEKQFNKFNNSNDYKNNILYFDGPNISGRNMKKIKKRFQKIH